MWAKDVCCVFNRSVVSDSCSPVDCSLPSSSVYGIFQARILERVAIFYSRGSSRLRDQTHISCVPCFGRWILYHCATWEAQSKEQTYTNEEEEALNTHIHLETQSMSEVALQITRGKICHWINEARGKRRNSLWWGLWGKMEVCVQRINLGKLREARPREAEQGPVP